MESGMRLFPATVTTPTGRMVGEARLWAASDPRPSGGWSGWLRAADLGGALPPGRYQATTAEGVTFTFEAGRERSRVFETELIQIRGDQSLPWDANVPAAALGPVVGPDGPSATDRSSPAGDAIPSAGDSSNGARVPP